MRSRRPSLWGRGMDITTEIVWDEIGPGLDGIVRDGLLNESENKDLLVESVLASYITYLSAVRDEGPLRTANDILPISFDRMLKNVLYSRARRILTGRLIEERFRDKIIEVNFRPHGYGVTPPLNVLDDNDLRTRAWKTAHQLEFLEYKSPFILGHHLDLIERKLYGDIRTLSNMGVTGISKSTALNWPGVPFSADWFQYLPPDIINDLALWHRRYLDEYFALVRINFPTLWQKFPLAGRMPLKCFIWITDTSKGPMLCFAKCQNASVKNNQVISCQSDQISLNRENYGHLFSAFVRHPGTSQSAPPSSMRDIPVGARIRVTGICMLENANPFNGEVPFSILMRNFDDIVVVARPPWLNVRHLVTIVGILLAMVIALGIRDCHTKHHWTGSDHPIGEEHL